MLDVNSNLLNRSINANKLSHAYLFETDYSDENIKFIFDFIKNIFTKNKTESEKENIIKKIDNNNFSELKIIKRDGQFIKKEQILALKEDFSVTAQESDVRVYVIYDSDMLNDSSANTLLKFLEEPDGQIVGILLTNNIYSVLKTLISRCQIISLPKNTSIELSPNYDLIVDLLLNIQLNNINVYNDIIKYETLFSSKDTIVDTLKNILIILSDVIYNKINDIYKYIIPNDKIRLISKNNTLNQLTKKINIINNLLEKCRYNLNSQLLFDRLIILMSGGDNVDSTN